MNEKDKKNKSPFVQGAISPAFIAESIAKHSSRTTIGAHQIFLGQIRNDEIAGKNVVAIDFSVYREMADEEYSLIREELFSEFPITCMHVYHSLGRVGAGEINLFVFVSSAHRKAATEACAKMVEMIKTRLPVWGKEIFEDENYSWKINS